MILVPAAMRECPCLIQRSFCEGIPPHNHRDISLEYHYVQVFTELFSL